MANKQHVLTLELKDDEDLICLYESYHQPGRVWPEVLASIRDSGIEQMQICRLGTLLVMVLQVNDKFSFEAKSVADNNNTKVQEWERLMERFQKFDVVRSGTAKWQVMDPLFQLDEH
ncbi:L-rhamnose mutarotase [Paraglaciecola sp.]|uniref:L-rhamnose mutarotase n=1 Tax=Paraglaciecola sp. TaxID=1920173 RepID=UPI00273E4FC7|nr:L-rhamnose mutarotase [Paraglaciecola sp.]MDP5031706.1 L-rhamnose mutarotase [Paraglaciecola sp.]